MKLAHSLLLMLTLVSFVACSSQSKKEPIVRPAKASTQSKTQKVELDDIEIEAERVSVSDLEAVGVKEKKIRELRDIQKDVILKAYEESPEEFYIVEEEVEEEPGQNIMIENTNFKLEIASVGDEKEIGKTKLSSASMGRLARIAALLNAYPDAWTDLTVHGFSDKYPTFSENVELAHRRAFLAVSSLRNQGVSESKMAIRAYGAKSAVAADDYSTWAKNRRVVIIVNNVSLTTVLAMQLKLIESEPINIAGPPPRVIIKESKPRLFKITVAGIGSGFKTAKDVLNKEARDRLQRLAILLDLHRDQWQHVSIHGHADIRGKAGYNLDLSNRRAFSVLRVLRSEGVPPSRLSTTAFGESKPLINKVNAYALQKNRRVEIMVSGVHKDTSLEKALKRLILPKKAVQ